MSSGPNQCGALDPHEVTHGFTLKSGWLAAAILHGRKIFENRLFGFAPGWYAVHVGSAKDGDVAAKQHVLEACADDEDAAIIVADMDAARVPKSNIVGLVHVAHALPLESCAPNPWALGPVCSVLDQTIWLETPVPCAGQLGLWRLSPITRAAITSQLPRSAIRTSTAATDYPSDPAAMIRHRTQKKESKRKREAEADGQQSTLGFEKAAR